MCMPQRAQEEIEDGLRIGRAWDDIRREATVRETQLKAKGMSLQLAGMIPPHDDPEWLVQVLEEIPLESLR